VVLGALGNFPLQEVHLGHCVDGFGGLQQFSFVRVDLGHCADGFWWFWGR
jgi:hypothetical protein